MHYQRFFPEPLTDYKIIVNAIIYAHTISSLSGLKSIMWTLEQARAPNVSALLELAEGVLKHPILSYTLLVKTFPISQAMAVLKLAMEIIYNPYICRR